MSSIQELTRDHVFIQFDLTLPDIHQIRVFSYDRIDLREYFLKKISSIPLSPVLTITSDPKEQIIEFLRPSFQLEMDNICNAILNHPIENRFANNIFERTFGINIPIPYIGNIFFIPITWILLECLWNFERTNLTLFRTRNRFHKGTAYAWMFEYFMIQDSIDTAFNYMIQAMEEDRSLNNYRDYPAYKVISLIEPADLSKPYHAYVFIKDYIDELKCILAEYNSEFGVHFQYSDLVSKFFGNSNSIVGKEKMLFVHSYVKTIHFINRFKEELSNNEYTAILALSNLFGLTLLFENMIMRFYPSEKLYSSLVAFCTDKKYKWNSQKVMDDLRSEYKDWEKQSENKFQIYLKELINLSFNLPISNRPSLQGSFLSAIGLIRNLAGHNTLHWKVISLNIEQLLKIILKAFFILIEYKY